MRLEPPAPKPEREKQTVNPAEKSRHQRQARVVQDGSEPKATGHNRTERKDKKAGREQTAANSVMGDALAAAFAKLKK
jgi:hypothetical protein